MGTGSGLRGVRWRVYRDPLSLSIFRGGKDYLVTDGPFADPLDLWCTHAHGREPT